tara:strand:- start:229 stop:2268 length:2040 start_codon:yes stop_codon:yes gene_type:complete
MIEVFAAYVWSQNWWTFSNDMWNGQSHTYENSKIVMADALDWDLVSSGEAYHASLYYELGKEDAHQFTPTRILVDNVDNPSQIVVEGTETFTGDDIVEAEDWNFEVGTTEQYDAGNMVVDFEITQIVVAKTEAEKEDIIVSFIERQSEIDQEELDSMSAETFNAPRKPPTKSEMRRSNRSRNKKNMMQKTGMNKRNTPTDKQMRYSENFTTSKYAESFRSESASDSIAAESSQTVSGVNPTPVSDGQWLAESISKRAEAKHSYPHRTIDGDNYVHHDSKGRETRRTNRGKSIKADRRRYTPNDKLKPGQGHLGDFVREAQGYDDRLDESMGMRNRGRNHGPMTMKDRRNMSRGMENDMYRRPNAAVRTMDRGNRRLRAERSLQTRRAESPLTSPESYSPTGSSPTDMNPKSDGPSSAGTGNEVIAVQSPSAPPSNIKFAEDHPDFDPVKADRDKDGKISSWERKVGNAVANGMDKEAEFGVVGQGSNFGQDLDAESICAKHAETYEACGCEKEDKRAEPSGSSLTNASTSSSDPLDDATLSGFDIVNVDSPSAPPSNIFEQSAEECGCDIGAVGACMCAETKAAEMNYDGSLYGDQYFPNEMTANQVGVGKLGSTPSADTSGQGVLEWDGGRVGPNPDTKAAEIMTRQKLGFVGAISLIAFGGYFLGLHDKVREFIKKE